MWFLNRSDTDRAVQAQKMARGWKFSDLESRKIVLSLYTVGSLNGIYGIKLPFPAPTGSATESTGILQKVAFFQS